MSVASDGIDISFSESSLRELSRFHGATIKQFDAARKRALTKLLRWLKTRIKRKFASASGLPQKVAGQRMRHYSNEKEGVVAIWLGLNAVEVHRAGRLSGGRSQRSAGVSVGSAGGRRFYKGSFQSDVYSGDGVQRVWIRKRSKHFDASLYPHELKRRNYGINDPSLASRFPLVMARIDIADQIRQAVAQDKQKIQAQMITLFEHELKVALGIIETARGRVR